MTKRQIMDKIPFKLLAVFLLLAAGIGAGGYFYYLKQKARAVEHIQTDLATIAQLKSEQIAAWRRERYGDAYVLAETKIFAAYVRRWFDSPKDDELRNNIYKRLNSFLLYDPYKEVLLVDPTGRVRLFVGQDITESISQSTKALIKQVAESKKILFSDFYYCEKCREVHLDLIAPLSDGPSTIGTIILRTNPDKYLFPLIQTWPTTSRSGETILVRREGQEIVYLNELKFQKGTAMKLRLPLTDTLLPAAMAALGKEGMVEGLDYRDVPVAAYIRHIPDSPWFMVAKVDKEEIYAPLKQQTRNIITIIILALVLLALGFGLLWQGERRVFYKKQYQLELEKQALVKHYDYLTKYANDIILLSDEKYNLIEVNARACQAYGYSREELLKMKASDLSADETKPQFKGQIDEMVRQGGMVYETVHKRKDGTAFPVEISARTIEIEGKSYLQGIVRDISERKQFELKLRDRNEELEAANQQLLASEEELKAAGEELRKQNEELAVSEETLKKSQKQLKNANELAHIGSWNWAIETDTVAWTEELYRIAGLDPAFPAPTYAEHSNIYTPESWARLKTAVEKAMSTGERYQMELELIRPDGTTRWVNAFGGASKDGRGNIIGLFGTVQDITERKLAEEALKKNEEAKTKLLENLNAAQHIALIGSWEWDVKTDKVWWSDETYQIFGVTPQDYTPSFEKNGEFIHPDDLEIYKQSFAQSLKTGKPLDVDIRLIAKDGVLKQCSASGKIIQDDDGRPFRFIGTIMDITKRKRIDEALLETSRRLELTLTISKAGTWDWDVIAGNIKWSPEMYKLFELDPLKTTASFESWKMKLHPEDVQLAESRIEKALKGKTRLNSDYRVVLSNGQIRWINATGEGVYDEKGQPTQMLGICLDITERKEAEIKIIENEQKFRQLAESIDIVFWLTDWTEKKLLYVNQAYEKVFGFTVESAYSDRMGWKKAVHPDDLEWVSKELQRHAVKEEFTELKYRIICQGKMKWIHEQAFPLKDETGKVIRFINVADDITDRKQAEEHIQKQLAELQRWQNTMLDREDRVMELKREVNELLEKIGQKHKYTSMGGTK